MQIYTTSLFCNFQETNPDFSNKQAVHNNDNLTRYRLLRISLEHHMYMHFVCMSTLTVYNDTFISYNMLVGSQSTICTTICLIYITIYSNVKNKYCSAFKYQDITECLAFFC